MARSRSPRPFVVRIPDPQSGLRHVLLRTLSGRFIVVGLALRLLLVVAAAVAGPLPAFFDVVDTVAGIAIAIGAGYFVVKLFVAAKRRLLWRVRRKLILSYIFVGFIPAILIVAFFLLGGFLLFNNLSSYLVQARLRAFSEEVKYLAQSTAVEIQRAGGRDAVTIAARRQTNAAQPFPGVSVAIVPDDRSCGEGSTRKSEASGESAGARPQASGLRPQTAGPWAHAQPPAAVPAWIGCSGFGGIFAYSHAMPRGDDEVHLLIRGVAFPDAPRPGYAVVVDVPVSGDLRQRLRQETDRKSVV